MENEEMMLEDAGRATDDAMGHLTTGEVVIPISMLEDPQVMEMLAALFAQYQMDIAEFTVGDPANKINPETGYPEFFSLRKFFTFKNVAPIAASFIPGVGPLGAAAIGAAAGASGGGGLKGALTGGATGYIGAGGINDTLVGRGVNSLSNAAGVGNIFGSSASGGLTGSLTKNLGDVFGTVSPVQGPVQPGASSLGYGGTGLAGSAARTASGLLPATGATGASAGGGSSFSPVNTIANVFAGLNQDAAVKKQQKQLLDANTQQQANLETFNPADITSQPNYQFNLEQGQQGLNRQLAASGALGSGRAIRAAAEYNQNYAGNAFQQAYANWLQKTQLKNQAIGSAGDVRANAAGAGAQNIAQSLSNAIGGRVGQFGGNSGLTPEQLRALGLM